MRFLLLLGRDIEMTVKRKPKSRAGGSNARGLTERRTGN